MVEKKFAVLTIIVLLAVLVLGCNGIEEDSQGLFTEAKPQQTLEANVNVPGYGSGVVPWEYEDGGVVPVLIQGQSEVTAANSKSASSLGGIAFIAPPKDGSVKASSTLSDGSGYYMSKNVAISEVNGVTFAPAAGESAYAMYYLDAPADTPFTVGIAWYSLPESMDNYFVGIGDSEMGAWHWYQGPDDGVLTFNPDDWSKPGTVNSTVMVCVALESGKPADFWQINWGVPEVRGTGLSYEQDASVQQLPVKEGKSASEALPTEFSLRPNLPAIANQGSMGSCTAFACTDAGLNILLDRLYGSEGWDVSQDDLRTSPMWAYVKSGIAPIGNWNPPCGSSVGRYMSQAFNVLEDIGSATKATVPYQATSNCETSFEALASTEADLLQISNWYGLGNDTGTIVETVKTQLAENGQPVVVAMYGLESAFLNYSSGVYHYGGTYGMSGGHAMCIVGYDDSIQAFDVRNSWGGYWGDGGYWWCGYDAVEDLIGEMSRMDLYTMSADFNPDTVTYFLGEGIILDETEPNNSIATANALTPFPVDFYSGELGSGDTEDFFSFEFMTGQATDFELIYDIGNGVASLGLYNAAGTLLAESATGDGSEELAGNWSGDGTGYLKVSLVSGAPSYNISGSERTPPGAPQNLSASDGTNSGGVMLAWDSVPGAAFYNVQRADSAGGDYLDLASSVNAWFLDTTVAALVTNWYRVSAVDFNGESLYSSPDSGYKSVPLVTGVNATDEAFAEKVEVTWVPVAEFTTYEVKRSMFADGPFSSLARVDGPVYEDFSVETGAKYYYVVCLVSEGNTGPESDADVGSTIGSVDSHEAVDDDSTKEDIQDSTKGDSLPGSPVDPGDGQNRPVVPITQ